MHTLMLHGHATTAIIFKAQTVPFRNKLDKSFTFDFVDGPYTCAPPRGLASIMPTARTWFKTTDVGGIRDAVDWLKTYIAKNGPYDCICCFSKASVIVTAMLMYEMREKVPKESSMMPKSIIFINGSLEYSFLEDLGVPITEEARKIKHDTEEEVKSKADKMSMLAYTMVRPGSNGLWDDTSRLVHDPKRRPTADDCFGLDLTKVPSDIILRLPTAQITGAKDPIWPSGVQLAYLCDPDQQLLYDHGGGHDLPRTPQVAEEMARIFKTLASRKSL